VVVYLMMQLAGDRFAHLTEWINVTLGRAGRWRRSLGDRGLRAVLVPQFPGLGIGTAG
jgi:hypothetical protein